MNVDPRFTLRKAQVVGILEHLCQALELSESQDALAGQRYEGVGAWLAAADDSLLRSLVIYLQGSTALRTTVKPLGRDEHDVDLVAHMRGSTSISPARVKMAIGDRLAENGHYAPLLEEKTRCWRLKYGNEFHLDITPSIPNPLCDNGGELVPDRSLREWKATNPKGYKAEFERRAQLRPRMRVAKRVGTDDRPGADVEPYPVAVGLKGILRRTVQISKRHRDIYFANLDSALSPISVIITTLASWSYEYCVANHVYDNELDLLCDVIRHMPAIIETRLVFGHQQWFIWNETTTGENFAEKWNGDPRRARAFFAWHARMLADLDALPLVQGLDQITKRLSDAFGSTPVRKVMTAMTDEVSSARQKGQLSVAPMIGLGLGVGSATPVRANTFFGAE